MEKYWTVGSIVALALFMSGLANATTTAPEPTPKDYLVYDQENASHVCLHMAAVLELNVNVSEAIIPVSDNGTLSSSSFCNSKTLNAILVIIGDDDEGGVYNLTFEFSGDLTQGNQHWSMDNIFLSLKQDDVSEPFSTIDKLYQASNARVEFTRSFKCDSSQTIKFNGNNTEIHPTLDVNHLQVQAFRFRNVTTGSFDNARVCLLDSQNKGNKIVPIAVGAALALLVIVVIVAYLIGRLWNRRKGSYETLN